jgi:hypothetical protein
MRSVYCCSRHVTVSGRSARPEVAPGLTPDSIQPKHAQMVTPTWITPGCVQFLENKKRFHTVWTLTGLSRPSCTELIGEHRKQRGEHLLVQLTGLVGSLQYGADDRLQLLPLRLFLVWKSAFCIAHKRRAAFGSSGRSGARPARPPVAGSIGRFAYGACPHTYRSSPAGPFCVPCGPGGNFDGPIAESEPAFAVLCLIARQMARRR